MQLTIFEVSPIIAWVYSNLCHLPHNIVFAEMMKTFEDSAFERKPGKSMWPGKFSAGNFWEDDKRCNEDEGKERHTL